MTPFERAFDETISHEGGYANNPADRGGETMAADARAIIACAARV